MRLWSIHPKYLDSVGLVTLWRETLLAQKVLQGKTEGYKNHSQLIRFKNHCNPLGAIASYLYEIWKEAKRRGYNFDQNKISRIKRVKKIVVTKLQLKYEFKWLCKKLKNRCPVKLKELSQLKEIEQHLLFKVVNGDIADWEKVKRC